MNLTAITPLSPRARRSTAIAAELRQLILSGQLKPGDRLPTEEALCARFVVSRTTLREAIQVLRTTGLLDVTPGRGSYVKLPDVSALMQDLVLAGRTGTISAPEIAHVRMLLQRDMLAALGKTPAGKRKDLYQYVLLRNAAPEENAHTEARWHLALAELAANALSKLLLEALLALDMEQRVHNFRDLDQVMRTIHIQMRVNAAVVDGDLALAERVLSQYIHPFAGEVTRGAGLHIA